MRFDWYVEHRDIEKVTNLFNKHKNNPFVQKRIDRNLNKSNLSITKELFFKAMVSCLITTQQRSGPESKVTKFINTTPFPLNYNLCISESDIKRFAQEVISRFGLWRSDKIADEVTTNLSLLERGLWDKILRLIEELRKNESAQKEKEAADFIDNTFKGFGPKQSRNLLQSLGLTQYEIPIDSRITKWLNHFGFPLKLSSTALSDQNYYNFVSEGLQILCKESDIKPCILDAVIFVSYDGNGWTEENVVW